MNGFERALVVLLRISGIILMTALVAAVMPFSWMDEVHRRLGMGDLPEAPITGYLARSLSVMYALHGAIVFFISLDIRRHLPVVKCLAALGVVFGAGMLVLDFTVGMPTRWTACEGPSVVILSGVLLWLANHVPEQREYTTGS